jgi:hypothetical protein
MKTLIILSSLLLTGCSLANLTQPEAKQIATEHIEQVLTRCDGTYVAGINFTTGVMQIGKNFMYTNGNLRL